MGIIGTPVEGDGERNGDARDLEEGETDDGIEREAKRRKLEYSRTGRIVSPSTPTEPLPTPSSCPNTIPLTQTTPSLDSPSMFQLEPAFFEEDNPGFLEFDSREEVSQLTLATPASSVLPESIPGPATTSAAINLSSKITTPIIPLSSRPRLPSPTPSTTSTSRSRSTSVATSVDPRKRHDTTMIKQELIAEEIPNSPSLGSEDQERAGGRLPPLALASEVTKARSVTEQDNVASPSHDEVSNHAPITSKPTSLSKNSNRQPLPSQASALSMRCQPSSSAMTASALRINKQLQRNMPPPPPPIPAGPASDRHDINRVQTTRDQRANNSASGSGKTKGKEPERNRGPSAPGHTNKSGTKTNNSSRKGKEVQRQRPQVDVKWNKGIPSNAFASALASPAICHQPATATKNYSINRPAPAPLPLPTPTIPHPGPASHLHVPQASFSSSLSPSSELSASSYTSGSPLEAQLLSDLKETPFYRDHIEEFTRLHVKIACASALDIHPWLLQTMKKSVCSICLSRLSLIDDFLFFIENRQKVLTVESDDPATLGEDYAMRILLLYLKCEVSTWREASFVFLHASVNPVVMSPTVRFPERPRSH